MSDESKYPTRIAPYGLRMPPDLKERVEAAAKSNNRSMNAEIVATLEEKFPPPQSGNALQRGVQAIFEDFGWTVKNDQFIKSYGVDIFAARGALTVIANCLVSLDNIPSELIERVATATKKLGADAGLIIGFGDPSSEAIKLLNEMKVVWVELDKYQDFPNVLMSLHPFRKSDRDQASQ